MMNKLKFWILIIVAVGIIYPSASHAIEYFRPNIVIPGMHNFFGDLASPDEKLSTATTTVYKYQLDESGIIRYIQALYSYSAIIAGVIAMFMLVFAAYQRLLAAGNAEKISRSSDTIRGTLLGLTILFSGYLLLSQISERLVVLTPINIPAKTISSEKNYCSDIVDEDYCNMASNCVWRSNTCTQEETGIENTCGLTAEEVAQNPSGLSCCGLRDEWNGGYSEYRYAIVTYNAYCNDACKENSNEQWTGVDRFICTNELGY